MPNDLLKTVGDYLNPEDVLTLAGPLAGFKPTAGITAALYAPSLNENEAEELDKLRAMRPPVAAPRETAQTPEMRDFVNRLRYEQFVGDLRKQYGQHADLMLQGLIKQGLQDEAQQARMTGPRAKPPAPPAARHEATVPEGRFRRYAEGGMIEHITPDMADGGRMIYTDSLDSYSGGGGVKGKTVQQMADELLTKGVKTPDLSRRGFMRLPDLGGPKESKLPVPAKDMERFQTEKTTVDPLSGSVEKVVEKVAQTPMSRRQVLQGALAQTAQRVLPSVAMQPVKDVASEVAKTVMKPTVFSPSTIQGAIAQGLKLGQSDEQILKAVTQLFGDAIDPEELLDVKIPAMRDPGEYYSVGEELGAPGPLEIFRTYTDNFGEDNLKQVMREIRSANPELYKTLKDAARDTDMTIAEMMPSLTYRNRLNAAQERALRSGQPFDLEKFKKRYGYEDLDPEDLDAEDLDYDDYD